MPTPSIVRARLRSAAVVALVVAVGFVAACSKSKKPSQPEVPVAPTPDSPQHALALLEWCWDQRNADVYHEVFTDDFQYEFAPSDSQAIGATITRDEELAIATNLFVNGVPGHPAASSVFLGLDPTLVVQADDRPGKNSAWHKRIASDLRLIVTTPGPDYSTTGKATFYVTRGDSALIPAELVTRGFRPDSTRWYVDHWTDGTSCPLGKLCVTVGRIKLAYAATAAGAVGAGR